MRPKAEAEKYQAGLGAFHVLTDVNESKDGSVVRTITNFRCQNELVKASTNSSGAGPVLESGHIQAQEPCGATEVDTADDEEEDKPKADRRSRRRRRRQPLILE